MLLKLRSLLLLLFYLCLKKIKVSVAHKRVKVKFLLYDFLMCCVSEPRSSISFQPKFCVIYESAEETFAKAKFKSRT